MTMTTTATPTYRYIFLLPFFSPPRPRPATSYDMSDLDRPRCRLVIRVSSSGGRRLHIQQETLDPGGGPELDGVRDLLLRKRDVGVAHVHSDAVALFLRSKNLIPRDRDHLAPLLILEEVVDRTRHRTKLHEKETRIVRVALGRTREEEESHFVAKQVALHRAEKRHAFTIVVHGDFRGRVGFVEDSIRCRSGTRDLGEGYPRTLLGSQRFDSHAQPQRREVQVVDAILYVHVAEDHPSPQTPKPFRNCSAISPSSTCENVSKSETAEYSASCSSR